MKTHLLTRLRTSPLTEWLAVGLAIWVISLSLISTLPKGAVGQPCPTQQSSALALADEEFAEVVVSFCLCDERQAAEAVPDAGPGGIVFFAVDGETRSISLTIPTWASRVTGGVVDHLWSDPSRTPLIPPPNFDRNAV